MWHDIVFLIVVAVLGFPEVTALRVGQRGILEHIAGKRTAMQSETVGASECEGHVPQWVQDGQVKRLKGPVVHIHIPGPYHNAGNYLSDLARDIGNMTSSDNNHWETCFEKKELWNDKTWTGLEDAIPKDHSLDDLGCGANKARIFSIALRHPLNMFFHRLFACRAWNKTLQSNPRADEDSDDFKACQAGAGSMCGPDQSNALEDESCYWDNIVLQSLVGPSQTGLEPLTRADLELAKSRLRHFDLIFIIEHFAETLQLTTTRLGWSPDLLADASIAGGHKAQELAVQNQFATSEITHEQWQRVIERNSLDIELYDYMRKLSFGMLRADGLPVPKTGSTAIPQWVGNSQNATRGGYIRIPQWSVLA